MNFPASPTNGQTYTTGTVVYTYSTVKSAWTATSNIIKSGFSLFETIASAGQTTFISSTQYTPGAIQVSLNGIVLASTDYTAVDGNIVTLNTAANAGDEFRLESFNSVVTNVTNFTSQDFTASAGQTTFTITNGYTVGGIEVYKNGLILPNTSYTATNGTTVVLTSGASNGDALHFVIWNYQPIANALTTTATAATYLSSSNGTSAITPATVWAAVALSTVSDASSVVIDFNTGINFDLPLSSAVGTSRVIANPVNAKAGQTGFIRIKQGTPNGQAATFGNAWHWQGGSTATLTTSTTATDILFYSVIVGGSTPYLIGSMVKNIS